MWAPIHAVVKMAMIPDIGVNMPLQMPGILQDLTLSPDFNEAHHDHFHVDMGPTRSCR